MSNFGALTDHFGILAIETLDDVLTLTASSKTPDAQSRADALDENNDPVASTWFGNTEGDLFDASSTFVCKSGSFSAALLKGGEVEVGKVITSIEISTSQDGWPQITVSGKIGAEAIVAPSGKLNTWTMPAVTVTGAKRAQLLDFTIGAGCKLTGSSISGALDIVQQDDGLGEPVAHGISGGVLTQTADLVRVTAAPSWTEGATFTETQAPGVDEGQAAYHTASAAAEKIWVRDASE
jgi:hypothetical protein